MKGAVAFIFFMLFLAGIAFVNLKSMKSRDDTAVTYPEQLIGVMWRATNIGEMRVMENSGIYIRFETDGKLRGDAGCNTFFGDYQLLDGHLTVERLGSTRTACPEPAMSFELSFLEALQSTSTAARSDDRLALRNADGIAMTRFIAVAHTGE
jgi:heat shock protein HslJ